MVTHVVPMETTLSETVFHNGVIDEVGAAAAGFKEI